MLVREALARLLGRQPLPAAEVELAQPGVQAQGPADEVDDGLGGVAGPGQVAADDDVRRRLRQHSSRAHRLGAADVVEVDVELALDHAERVVAGAAVPQQDDATRGRDALAQGATRLRPAARSASRSTNGIVGQSFQSRSRA